jgi:hypothetical protein
VIIRFIKCWAARSVASRCTRKPLTLGPYNEHIVNNPDWSRGVANNFDEAIAACWKKIAPAI